MTGESVGGGAVPGVCDTTAPLSHVLQPLMVGCLSSWQQYYRLRIDTTANDVNRAIASMTIPAAARPTSRVCRPIRGNRYSVFVARYNYIKCLASFADYRRRCPVNTRCERIQYSQLNISYVIGNSYPAIRPLLQTTV